MRPDSTSNTTQVVPLSPLAMLAKPQLTLARHFQENNINNGGEGHFSLTLPNIFVEKRRILRVVLSQWQFLNPFSPELSENLEILNGRTYVISVVLRCHLVFKRP